MLLSDVIVQKATATIQKAIDTNITLAVAESCTGGLIGAALTAVPGSSEVFQGGVISYANEAKMRLLGVQEEVLSSVGAVSAECAAQMATGAKQCLKADLAIATTGIAGPGGGEPGKPVGTVWFGVAGPEEGTSGAASAARTKLCTFNGDRDAVRTNTVLQALDLLYAALDQKSCR